ncbi:MBL fold metallo-hydrolase [Streptomyces albipurpureus]|uniref:MBL fold metallo-hydrolase n=1 Tax=Streptomyces albipurpureus TaxID=2897419 RepID=A0ABT0UHR3_9ACTN|nr:MBL fold metallo-hydrolase [Streptomyces sp. CWNU-1]MCM2388183.1 MBL fold metallo-hydrolase [Streptomyces sp. CWNU-1]
MGVDRPRPRTLRSPAGRLAHHRDRQFTRRHDVPPRHRHPAHHLRRPHHGGHPISVTATPARHGPPLSRPITGQVTGFALGWEGQQHGVLWISGDTVLYRGLREVAQRLTVGTALLHLGGVRFPITGPLRYTMTAAQAMERCRWLRPHTAIPVHYEGWHHFYEGRPGIERELTRVPDDIRDRFRFLHTGTATGIDA